MLHKHPSFMNILLGEVQRTRMSNKQKEWQFFTSLRLSACRRHIDPCAINFVRPFLKLEGFIITWLLYEFLQLGIVLQQLTSLEIRTQRETWIFQRPLKYACTSSPNRLLRASA